MDVSLGFCGTDFAVLAADMTSARSIMCFKHDEEKIFHLDNKKVLVTGGDQSSRTQFAEYIQRNIALQRLRSGLELSTHATANFTRNEIARALRSRGAYQANCILAGVDKTGNENEAALYFLDYLGSLQKVEYTAHGYGSYFALSIMDRRHRDVRTVDDAVKLIKECCTQLAQRFLINLPAYRITIVTPKGITELETYNPQFEEFDKPRAQIH